MGLRSTLALAAVLVACGDNLAPEPDVDSTVVIALDTTAPMQVAAGDAIAITCTLLENDITTAVPADVRVVAEADVLRMSGQVIARKVGLVDVSCALPDRGLVDPTPATVEIVAGPAANLVTTIAPDPVVAGNTVMATCEVFDAFGNPIDNETPTLQLSPMDAANPITDLQAFMTRAGHYTARCALPGATSNNAGFDVIPNLPATLALARFPDLPVYAVGNVVEVGHIVTDRYGNEIFGAATTKTVTPITGTGPVVNLAHGQWRFDGEGRYRVDVTVDPPTDEDVVLTADTEILINSKGPAITCENDARMLNLTPGTTLTVNGDVNDVNGVASLTVNGATVSVGADGSFTANITTRFGMNFVDVSATDTLGEPTTKVCTFLVSNRYGSTLTPIGDAVSLKLTQRAVDDGNRTPPINSFDDLLYAILNSSGLSNTLHNSLLGANPIKPLSCDSQTCAPFIGCICWFSSGVEYRNRSLPGPNTVSLTLVPGGLRAQVRIPNVGVNLRVWGRVSGIPYDTTGWVRMSFVDIAVTLDTAISNNQPNISVRPGSVTATVGIITTDFAGIDGWIISNIIVPLAHGPLRVTVQNILRDFVANNFNAALDGVIGNLDVATLGTTFNVPRLDGSGTVSMAFGLAFSHLNTTSSRMLFGIGTRFSAPIANAFLSSGVPLPPGVNLLDPTLSGPANTGVGVHVAVLNGALHALWRANYFKVTIPGSALGSSVPSSVSIALTTRLPPVAMISNTGVVQLHIGAVDLFVEHPDLPPGLGVTLGADAHGSVTLVGNDIVFGGIVIDDLHVSTDAVDLTPSDQQELEDTLTLLVQKIADEALNDAIPALPIPAFTIPSSLSTFGLPAGRQLGINSPALTTAPQHFTLRGQFGLRP